MPYVKSARIFLSRLIATAPYIRSDWCYKTDLDIYYVNHNNSVPNGPLLEHLVITTRALIYQQLRIPNHTESASHLCQHGLAWDWLWIKITPWVNTEPHPAHTTCRGGNNRLGIISNRGTSPFQFSTT